MTIPRVGYVSDVQTLDRSTPWHDPRWRVRGVNPLQAGLRLQQSWWRQECRGIADAGRLYPPPKKGKKPRARNPLVASILPEGLDGFEPNLMWPEVVDALEESKRDLNSAAGILYEDRLRRNLLSSQPLCFNLFGYLSRVEPNALVRWVQSMAPDATSVVRIRLEYAPTVAELGELPLGGSAFDAFVEYEIPGERLGFIGIETKYHEDLAKALMLPSEGSPGREKYVKETARRPWKDGAALRLLEHRRNLQFWYNQLLAQRTFELLKRPDGSRLYAEYAEVVVASDFDSSATRVVSTVVDSLPRATTVLCASPRSRTYCAQSRVTTIGRVSSASGTQTSLRSRSICR
ncbi:MAG TPA: hypothetical protein VFK41_08955 [Nocardioidaceae bacterium]|nr:hypothetical protein [Nocardioidaceae bacterium]